MKNLFLLITTVSLSFSLMGQMTTPPPPLKAPSRREIRQEEENHKCRYTNKYNSQTRHLFYPYKQASKILLVSFDVKPDSTEGTELKIVNKLPIKNGRVDYNKLDELKLLSKSQIDTLTDILFNYNFSGPVNTMSLSMCYIPRNAILFLDATGDTYEYIEICFECHRMEPSSKNVELGEQCEQKIDLLKGFFIQQGLRVGTLTWKGKDDD